MRLYGKVCIKMGMDVYLATHVPVAIVHEALMRRTSPKELREGVERFKEKWQTAY